MPRHEVSVVNLQLGIKASKYLIHQTRFVYASRVSFGKRWRRNSIRVALLQSLRRKKKNACLKKKKKFLEISDSKRHWPSEICLLYLPFGWTSSVGWLKLASTGDTNAALHSKFNREDKLRRNPTSPSRSLSRLLVHFAVRPTFKPASTLPGARQSRNRRCNLNILYARQTYFKKCVDSANCSTDIPQVARQTPLKSLPRLDESKKLLLALNR